MLVTSINSLPLKDTYGRLKMVMTAVHKTGAKVRVEIWAFPKGSEFRKGKSFDPWYFSGKSCGW